jgi:hypothetical protein
LHLRELQICGKSAEGVLNYETNPAATLLVRDLGQTAAQRRSARKLRTFRLSCRNSFTAWRTRADTGASDFFDIAVSALTCSLVSQTTVLFMTLWCPVVDAGARVPPYQTYQPLKRISRLKHRTAARVQRHVPIQARSTPGFTDVLSECCRNTDSFLARIHAQTRSAIRPTQANHFTETKIHKTMQVRHALE